MDWMQETLVSEGMINSEDMDLIFVTDSAEEAVAHIIDVHQHQVDREIDRKMAHPMRRMPTSSTNTGG